MHRIWTVAKNTIRQAIRLKIVTVFTLLLLILLPVMGTAMTGDGTLKGRLQLWTVTDRNTAVTSYYRCFDIFAHQRPRPATDLHRSDKTYPPMRTDHRKTLRSNPARCGIAVFLCRTYLCNNPQHTSIFKTVSAGKNRGSKRILHCKGQSHPQRTRRFRRG